MTTRILSSLAALVHVDGQVGPALHQPAARAGVIEVDVRRQHAARLEARPQPLEQGPDGRLRAGIHQKAVDLPATDHALGSDVDDVDSPHGQDLTPVISVATVTLRP